VTVGCSDGLGPQVTLATFLAQDSIEVPSQEYAERNKADREGKQRR